mmetsp:Transcript_14235/g.17932  ORF Transcript_14235/g.17932 Transcript_14235/m.17932 type:complete len:450 (+) Transcript_14235:144-1493(+)|eukprot:CAMPEP_0172502802 /NCGR_PEP_ID=MMETSP1066-20121228/162868_1 /TAXON_ID=671091 /ORGANISM="Coscinodiscus wailesii, Strain CCMP2513" /LENGTH=449 /DNA_ID=CAMNT_0013278189 /DNA_START=142 /DNA_END=1491 /DNA_ORIENTATION=-
MADNNSTGTPPTADAIPEPPTETIRIEKSDGNSSNPRDQKQISKLRDANAKYKSLLKMAKERIQAQEDEIQRLKDELNSKASAPTQPQPSTDQSPSSTSNEPENDTILRVLQRVKISPSSEDVITHNTVTPSSTSENMEIHALVEYESNYDEVTESFTALTKKWHQFDSEAALENFIRRDTGEPIALPPYSLTPEQSRLVEEESRQAVSHVTEEFRRYRVRAEVARKQADATVRALHSNNVLTTKRRIEGQDLESELALARTEHAQLDTLKRELASQEAHWKKAYDTLLAENTALKSSGAEALLAAQWRQRYETCLREKEDLDTRLKMVMEKLNKITEDSRKADAGKYEVKYRELKEAFRSYRKKAKEIFEDLQDRNSGLLIGSGVAEDPKIQYLRNLMVNYLTSDPAVRDHMELAIGTVLKFSDEEKAKIDEWKKDTDSWYTNFSILA